VTDKTLWGNTTQKSKQHKIQQNKTNQWLRFSLWLLVLYKYFIDIDLV